MKRYFVYIMCNKPYGTLYIGVTSDLEKRNYEHAEGVFDGFTKKYDLKMLVYYEIYEDPERAIQREKNLKRWNRDWKIDLINQHNPAWQNLALNNFMMDPRGHVSAEAPPETIIYSTIIERRRKPEDDKIEAL